MSILQKYEIHHHHQPYKRHLSPHASPIIFINIPLISKRLVSITRLPKPKHALCVNVFCNAFFFFFNLILERNAYIYPSNHDLESFAEKPKNWPLPYFMGEAHSIHIYKGSLIYHVLMCFKHMIFFFFLTIINRLLSITLMISHKSS